MDGFLWTEITSAQNPTIKEVAKLRNERQRKKQNRILIDGVREITRAAEAGIKFESLITCAGAEPGEGLLAAMKPQRGYQLPPKVFQKVAFGERNEGVVAVAIEEPRKLEDLIPSQDSLILVLDGIEKPGNMGAVFRSASAAGVDLILLTNEVCSPFNANAIRASLGTVFELPFVSASLDKATEYLRENGIRVVTTRVDAGVDYTEFDFTQAVALVLGSEAHGVATDWHQFESVTIPMRRSVDSLNISVTAALVAFEAQRQRKNGR